MIGQALVNARVARAVELDINPEWVAGYLYARSERTEGFARGIWPEWHPRALPRTVHARLLYDSGPVTGLTLSRPTALAAPTSLV